MAVRTSPRAAGTRDGAPPQVSADLSLLDGFELSRRGRSVPLPMGGQRVVAFLALHDRALPRGFVAGVLWPDSTEHRAAASLRSTLWRLRNPGPPVLETTDTHVWLSDRVRVDTREATAIARRLLHEEGDIVDPGPLLRGDLLPGWYDDWVVLERERIRQLRLHALEALCYRLISAGRLPQAIEVGLAAVEGEPLRESGHRALIAAYLAEGNRWEAIRHYRIFCRLLEDEGEAPSPQIERLIACGPGELPGRLAGPRQILP